MCCYPRKSTLIKLLLITRGLTSKLQICNVAVSKQVKGGLSEQYNLFCLSQVPGDSIKIAAPSCPMLAQWLCTAWSQVKPAAIIRGTICTGIACCSDYSVTMQQEYDLASVQLDQVQQARAQRFVSDIKHDVCTVRLIGAIVSL